jgi:predicted NBD/HSP70 family sugar kinase/DNA-binding Lrp family transcriptional regulator
VEPKPSFDLVRLVTDEHVLRALMRDRRLTRAELASLTGISKPTAGESVRRLSERGLVVDTGERTPGGRGRGRVGSYYALAEDVGTALAVSIAPEGVVAERINAYGEVLARAERPVGRPARPDRVAAALRAAVAEAAGSTAAGSTAAGSTAAGSTAVRRRAAEAEAARIGTAEVGAAGSMVVRCRAAEAEADGFGPAGFGARGAVGARPRLAVVSAADPVDRATGRLIHLPDSPFLVGELDPVALLAPEVDGPVIVDNDVNWAALAERAHADFAYVHLGEGLGCALVTGAEVWRGHAGLAGEIAHVITAGPDGAAIPFIEVFGRLGLRRPGSTAIDVERLLAECVRAEVRGAVAEAVAGVLAAVGAIADPELVVIGGPWGGHPDVLDAIRSAVARSRRPVRVRAAELTEEPSLAGARGNALHRLRAAIVAT